jgi:hypothetical protein
MPEIPAPAHVLRALAPVWPPLYTALEWATQQTRAYFDAERMPIDRHLAPSLVRYQAKRHLARLGHHAQEDEGKPRHNFVYASGEFSRLAGMV